MSATTRHTFAISKEKLAQLEAYRYDNKIKNQTQAILSLINKGLSALESEKDCEIENSPSIAEAIPGGNAQKLEALASALDQLNEEGQDKLLDYAEDLVASGRYIKNNSDKLGNKKYA